MAHFAFSAVFVGAICMISAVPASQHRSAAALADEPAAAESGSTGYGYIPQFPNGVTSQYPSATDIQSYVTQQAGQYQSSLPGGVSSDEQQSSQGFNWQSYAPAGAAQYGNTDQYQQQATEIQKCFQDAMSSQSATSGGGSSSGKEESAANNQYQIPFAGNSNPFAGQMGQFNQYSNSASVYRACFEKVSQNYPTQFIPNQGSGSGSSSS